MNSNELHTRFEIHIQDGWLCLHMTDKSGRQYRDGSIVRVGDKIGVIRYSFGRFEILCTFKDQRFIYGLNPSYEILGHIADKDNTAAQLEVQASQPYASNG